MFTNDNTNGMYSDDLPQHDHETSWPAPTAIGSGPCSIPTR